MDRLAMLERLCESRPEDPFPRYGRAMELDRLGHAEAAVSAFAELSTAFPDYVPAYLQAGQRLIALGRIVDAAATLEQGIGAARRAGDTHALGELEALLAGLG